MPDVLTEKGSSGVVAFPYPGYLVLDSDYCCLGCSTNLQKLLRIPEGDDLLACIEKSFVPSYRKMMETCGDQPGLCRLRLGDQDEAWEVLVLAGASQMADRRTRRTLVIMDAKHYNDLKAQLWNADLADTIYSLTPGFLHTLRNPLNSMSIALFLLREALTKQASEQAMRYLGILEQDLKRMDESLTQVFSLLLGQPDSGSTRIDARELLGRLPRLLRHEPAARHLQLQLDVSAESMVIEVNPVRLLQVIIHIVSDMAQLAGRISVSAHPSGDHVEMIFRSEESESAAGGLKDNSCHREERDRHLILAQDIAESMGGQLQVQTEDPLSVRLLFGRTTEEVRGPG